MGEAGERSGPDPVLQTGSKPPENGGREADDMSRRTAEPLLTRVASPLRRPALLALAEDAGFYDEAMGMASSVWWELVDLSDPSDATILAGAVTDEADGRPVVTLHAVLVDPRRWGQGLGGRIVADLADALRRRGAERVVVSFVIDDRARAFYESLGFEPSGDLLVFTL